MSLRRRRSALLVVVALTAMALSVAFDVTGGDRSERGNAGVAFVVGGTGVDGPYARLGGAERRDGASSERALKQRLAFFALLALLLCAVAATPRGFVVRYATVTPSMIWWSPHAGRSPPSFSSSSIA